MMVFVFLKIIKASLSNVLFSKVLIVSDMIFQIVAPQICTQIADTQNVCADKRFFNGRQKGNATSSTGTAQPLL